MKNNLFSQFIVLFLSVISIGQLKSQIKCKIDNFSNEDGLSHDIVRSILKDREGFMWFATWDGINRFDGRNFVTYKATAGDHSELENNRIDIMREDAFGNIWLKAYDDQIYKFDKKKTTFLSISKILGINKIEFNAILPSNDGNVWLTTVKNGIYQVQQKKDGQVKIFHFGQGLKTESSLASNQINFSSVDKNNTVWVGSGKGLDVISKNKDGHYKSRRIISNSNVNSFYTPEKGNVWFGTKNGELIRYNKGSRDIQRMKISAKSINFIIKSKNSGLLHITSSSGELITFNTSTLNIESKLKISDAPVYKIFQDSQGLFWAEPERSGVIMVDLNTKKIQNFSQKIDVSIYMLKNSYEIFEDNFQRVWVKLKGGGFGYYNKKTQTFDYFYNKPGDVDRKFSNMVSTTYFDPSGILWMSTSDGGINKVILQQDNFQHKLLISDATNQLENEIRAIYSDKKNRLWMASKAGKLKVFQNGLEIKNLFKNFNVENIGLIYTIIEDSKGNIWLGTKGNGLFKAKPLNSSHSQYDLKQFRNNKNNPNSISSDLIYSILEDQKGRIWVGTYGNGVNLLKDDKNGISFINQFKNYPSGFNKVRYLAKGFTDEIMVATTNGLLNFNPDQLKFCTYVKSATDKSSLNSNDILYIHKDSEQKIWLATAGGGLSLVSKNKDNQLRFKNFTKEDGLSSDFILSIVEDRKKNLWLATENGISKFSLANHTFRNFDSYDGLFKTSFSEASSVRSVNGNLIFGCKNGYLILDPKKIKPQKSTTKMVFTSFEVNNKISGVNSEESPLKQDVNYNNEIKLDYLHNTVSIYYTTLDYRSGKKQSYAYRLKGLDDRWSYVKNQRRATFTDLPPGDYEFEVKSLNTDLYDNIPSKRLSFTITPPFWRTNLANFVYAILFLILLEMIRRIAYSMIRLRNNVLVEKKMTDLKLSFFTNISHELRTPLTLIVNPIEEVAKNENLSSQGSEYIEIARKNSNRLVRFVNQLLDFRKVQSGNEELRIERIELVNFIDEIVGLFSQASQEKHIVVKTKFDEPEIVVNLDKDKLDIIIYNLLSNAIKFSPDNGEVLLEINKNSDDILKINVIDHGTGVDEKQLEDIFKLYYETKSGNTKSVGTGIGLALCKEYVELHKGSIIAFNNEFGGLTVSVTIDLKRQIFAREISDISEKPIIHQNVDLTKEIQINSNPIENENAELPLVLIVEDNFELRLFLKNQLQKFYRILEAENGREGLFIAEKHLPDLIVSDITMPEMDGIELLKSIKLNSEISHIPFILLTAKSSIENQIEGLKYGADFYITKPFSTEFLLASVENLLKSRRLFFENLQNTTTVVSLDPSEIVITTKDEQFLKDIIAIVEEKSSDSNFNVEVLIKSLNVSRATFNRKFKSLTNITAVEFIKEIRVKRGKQYMDAGEKDIATVAYNVGFNNAGYFSTCFKEVFGMSPSDYIKNNR